MGRGPAWSLRGSGEGRPQRPEQSLLFLSTREERLHGDVVGRNHVGQEGLDLLADAIHVRRHWRAGRGVSELWQLPDEVDLVRIGDRLVPRRLRIHRPAVARHRPTRQALGELYVGLVEGVDAEGRSGHGHAHLPDEEERAEFLGPFKPYAQRRVAGRLERVEDARRLVGFSPLLRFARRVPIEKQADEDPVLAVLVRRARRLGDDRDDAPALLAGALGEELLRPVRKRLPVGRREEGDLVAPREREFPQRRPEEEARVVAGLVLATVRGLGGLREKRGDVGPGERRRRQTERAQGREAAPHLGRVPRTRRGIPARGRDPRGETRGP